MQPVRIAVTDGSSPRTATFAEGHSDANNALKGHTKIVNSANFQKY
jgi:hypothetical protein